MKRVISFDLFETLVNRKVWPHYSVIWFLAEKIKKSTALVFSTDEFIKQRLEAGRTAYRSLKAKYTLSQIYEIFDFPALPAEIIHQLPALEANLEVAMAGPIDINVQKFRKYQQAGKRVIIVTDTYLERDAIERIVEKVGIVMDPQDIFISNEHGHFKVKGKFFKAIGKDARIRLLGSRHIGNSRGADVHGAIYAGMIPTYFREGNCNRLEATLSASIDAPNLTMAALVGEIRNWRLANIDAAERSILMSATIGFAALAYLSWIIRTCREQHIRRVYFMARDSYVLAEIAKLDAFSRHQRDIEFRYLFGSRTTIDAIDEDEQVHQYLQQEGVFDGVTTALVDIGWRGTFHSKLHDYIIKQNLPPVYGLFLGLDAADTTDLSRLRFSIFNQRDVPSKRLENRFDANFIYLVEALFQAPYPSTVGYSISHGKIKPIFEESSFDYTQLKTILSSSLQFMERVLKRPEFRLDEPALEVALKEVLVRIALKPSRKEAIAYGSLSVESDADENIHHYPLSPPYTIMDIGRILLRKQGLNNYRRQWAKGRIMASGMLFRKIMGYLSKHF